MRKIFILLLSCCFFAACSQEEIIESAIDSDYPQPRAANDIFTLTKVPHIISNDGLEYEYERGVDYAGNFYWITDDYEIYKYDQLSNEVNFFAPYEGFNYPGYFCFDEKNNLCHLVIEWDEDQNKYYYLRRIKSDGISVSDLPLELPEVPEVSRWSLPYYPHGMCAAPNGNIFILLQEYPAGIKYYRISVNGVLTEPALDLSGIPTGGRASLFKASGGTQYITGISDMGYWKINPNTASVEFLDSPVQTYFNNCIAGSGKGNLYTLNGRKVVQLRPNAASDLVIGTIPDKILKDGKYVYIGTPQELYMNPDATIFYIVTDSLEIYKLTL